MSVVFRGFHRAAGRGEQLQGPLRGNAFFRPAAQVYVHPGLALAVLRLARDFVQAGGIAEGPAESHVEDIAAERVRTPGLPDGGRGGEELLGVASFHQGDAVPDPAGHGIRAVQARSDARSRHRAPEGPQGFQAHAGREEEGVGRAPVGGEHVVQHLPGHVAAVFGGEHAQQEAAHFRVLREELVGIRVVMGMGGADGVFLGEAPAVRRVLFGGGAGGKGVLGRRDDVQVGGENLAQAVVQAEGHGLVGGFGEAETIPFTGPDQQVAEARVQGRLPVGAGPVGGHGVEFGVVVDVERDRGAFHGLPAVQHRDDGAAGGDIAADDVDLGVAGGALDDVFGAAVVAIDLGVEQQGAGDRAVEPGVVEGGRGFAGAHEMPLAVHPDLHPGVVVVGVGPARGIDLAGRDAGGAQGGDGQHGLLAAAADAPADRGHRGARPAVGGLVGGLFVAPVVDLQGGFGQAHAPDPGAERIGIDGAEVVQAFVVDAERQHEVPELPLGDVPAHAVAHFEGLGDIGLPEAPGVLEAVGQGHRLVEPVQVVRFAAAAGGR